MVWTRLEHGTRVCVDCRVDIGAREPLVVWVDAAHQPVPACGPVGTLRSPTHRALQCVLPPAAP